MFTRTKMASTSASGTRALVLLALVLAFGALTGCEAVTDRVRERFVPQPAQVRGYEADEKVVYAAAKATLGQMGFQSIRGGLAGGKLSAVSGLTSDDALRGSRQIAVKVVIARTLDGGSEVSLAMTEVIADDFNRGSGPETTTPLRNSPLYEGFFRGMEQALSPAEKD